MMCERTSLLLQMPQNVRERIWSYTYGDIVVHAEPEKADQKMKPSGDYAFRYIICQQGDPLPNSSRMPDCCPCVRRGSVDERTPFFWPIVNKQFWSETIQLFYESATFKVGSSIDLYILASSRQQSVRRMRNLEVRLGLGIKHHNRIWSPARCQSVIKNFESLQSLTLLIGLVVGDDSNYTGTVIDYSPGNNQGRGTVTRGSRLEGHEWQEQRNWLPVFLRLFQQHNLDPELTNVAIIDRCKSRQKKSPNWHEKDRRWQQGEYRQQREDDSIQETRRQELAASMRALLLGQSVTHLFPDWELENERTLAKFAHS
ncbi:hypothetical protein SVAN01_01201 [Stagonosporopsis vannaccii]|nr:hypothetical protein SVAN01_01201 [Stagonosporopsis vannaccii]